MLHTIFLHFALLSQNIYVDIKYCSGCVARYDEWWIHYILNIFLDTGCPTIDDWVFTLFWLFSQIPAFIERSILPFFNSPGDILRQKLIKLQSKTWGKLALDIISINLVCTKNNIYVNTVCLKFCSVTWSRKKVRWVMEYSSTGLLKMLK